METELLEIEGITLLSIEEAEKIPKDIRTCGDWWWLRSPGYFSDNAADVLSDGSVSDHGNTVRSGNDAVRPALIIPDLESLGLEKFKDSIEIFDVEWIYIGNGMVLAEYPIFHSRFDSKSNDYETSEIKQKLEDWLDNKIYGR